MHRRAGVLVQEFRTIESARLYRAHRLRIVWSSRLSRSARLTWTTRSTRSTRSTRTARSTRSTRSTRAARAARAATILIDRRLHPHDGKRLQRDPEMAIESGDFSDVDVGAVEESTAGHVVRVAAQNAVHERHDQRVVVHHLDLQQVGILHGDPARPDRVWTEGQVVVGQGVAAVVLALAVFLPRLGGRADDGDLGI